ELLWPAGTVQVDFGQVLTAALFDDEAATGFDDGPSMETPRQEILGGAPVVIAAGWSSVLPGAVIR
ncbi:MAG: hypothetical protein ACRD0D_10370, partial [Acidimicrobiales bacterium]